MMRPIAPECLRPDFDTAAQVNRRQFWRAMPVFTLGVLLAAGVGAAQVLTIDTSGKGPMTANAPVDHQYTQITPTHVELGKTPLDVKTKLGIVRIMQAEQGFAMRPFPAGHKGLTLVANGELSPAGEAYLNLVVSSGLSAKPGGRLVVTDVKIDHNKMIFDLNGGPDAKHRFLRHVQIGMGPDITNPVVADDGQEPVGSRLTLAFKGGIPELTGDQVKALLAPLISFDVKTPVQAYTDTLPKPLKEAILNHQVLVGMSTEMVMFSKGQPVNKSREMDGQMPIEIWMYGRPPETVEFVRINGNRVIRVEIAPVGKPMQVFTQDVVTPMLQGTPAAVEAENQNVHIIREGDVERDPNKEAPDAPPTLAAPGEKLPDASNTSAGQMKPVHFPKQQPDNQPGANPDDQQPAAQPGSGAGAGGSQQPAGQQAPASQQQPAGNSAPSGSGSGSGQSSPPAAPPAAPGSNN
jgi:hypothetical protein